MIHKAIIGDNALKSQTRRFLKKINDQKFLQAMAIPGFIWMLIFCYIPMLGIIIAFQNYNVITPILKSPWVGFSQFSRFFQDDRFFLVMRNSICISLLKLVIGFPLPIIFAILLNELAVPKFKRIVQTMSYLPHFLSWVIVGGMAVTWLSDSGLITNLLVSIGILNKPITFLAEPVYFWPIVIITEQWKEIGFGAIIYLAAISAVDPELHEAATIDGAGRFRRIWHVTLPSIRDTIAILLVLSIGYLFYNNFDQILVLGNATNYDVSDVLEIYVYRLGIRQAQYSYATAIGLFRSVLSLILVLFSNYMNKKLTGYSLF